MSWVCQQTLNHFDSMLVKLNELKQDFPSESATKELTRLENVLKRLSDFLTKDTPNIPQGMDLGVCFSQYSNSLQTQIDEIGKKIIIDLAKEAEKDELPAQEYHKEFVNFLMKFASVTKLYTEFKDSCSLLDVTPRMKKAADTIQMKRLQIKKDQEKLQKNIEICQLKINAFSQLQHSLENDLLKLNASSKGNKDYCAIFENQIIVQNKIRELNAELVILQQKLPTFAVQNQNTQHYQSAISIQANAETINNKISNLHSGYLLNNLFKKVPALSNLNIERHVILGSSLFLAWQTLNSLSNQLNLYNVSKYLFSDQNEMITNVAIASVVFLNLGALFAGYSLGKLSNTNTGQEMPTLRMNK